MRLFISLLFLFVFIPLKGDFQNAAAVEKVKDENSGLNMKRLEEMDKALTRIEGTAVQKIESGVLVPSQITTDKGSLPEVSPVRDKTPQRQPISNGVKNAAEKKLPPGTKMKGIPKWLVLLTGVALFSGSVILIIRYLKYKWEAVFYSKLAEIKSRLREKEERLNQEEIIRKAIEQAQVQKEKDYNQLKNSFEFLRVELQQKNGVLIQKEAVIGEKEQNSLQKEQECKELKKIIGALKDLLVRRRIMGKSLSLEEDSPWIPGESTERRELGRLDLSRDYNRSVLLRINSRDKSKTAKCFTGNISLDGLYFESEIEFQEKEILNLRLFFFGDKVPMMRIKAEVVWVKKAAPDNHYGVSLLFQEDKNKAELKEYIESHMVK